MLSGVEKCRKIFTLYRRGPNDLFSENILSTVLMYIIRIPVHIIQQNGDMFENMLWTFFDLC